MQEDSKKKYFVSEHTNLGGLSPTPIMVTITGTSKLKDVI